MMVRLKDVPENRTIIGESLLDQDTIARAFGVTSMTILKWRTEKGLPFTQLSSNGRAPIKFNYEEVTRWAKNNGVPIAPLTKHEQQG